MHGIKIEMEMDDKNRMTKSDISIISRSYPGIFLTHTSQTHLLPVRFPFSHHIVQAGSKLKLCCARYVATPTKRNRSHTPRWCIIYTTMEAGRQARGRKKPIFKNWSWWQRKVFRLASQASRVNDERARAEESRSLEKSHRRRQSHSIISIRQFITLGTAEQQQWRSHDKKN